jgi:hypothetical protein
LNPPNWRNPEGKYDQTFNHRFNCVLTVFRQLLTFGRTYIWRNFYDNPLLQAEMSDSRQELRTRQALRAQSSAVQNHRLVVQAENRSLPAEIREVPA